MKIDEKTWYLLDFFSQGPLFGNKTLQLFHMSYLEKIAGCFVPLFYAIFCFSKCTNMTVKEKLSKN